MQSSPKQNRYPRRFWPVIGSTFAIGVAVAIGVSGWRMCGPYGVRCSEAGQYFPHYNADMGRIDFVMHDLSGDGIIETWVHRSASRIEQIEIDEGEDGTIDRRLVRDRQGSLRVVGTPSHP